MAQLTNDQIVGVFLAGRAQGAGIVASSLEACRRCGIDTVDGMLERANESARIQQQAEVDELTAQQRESILNLAREIGGAR